MSGPRRAILRSLATRSGDIVDTTGFATSKLLADPQVAGFPPQSIRRSLAALDTAGLVVREINGRRVYRIALTGKGREVAAERGLTSGGVVDDHWPQQARISGERHSVIAAAATIADRLLQWAATIDISQSLEETRVSMLRQVIEPLGYEAPAEDALAHAIVQVNALNAALLSAYRTHGPDLDKVLVESHLTTALELVQLVGGLHADIERRGAHARLGPAGGTA